MLDQDGAATPLDGTQNQVGAGTEGTGEISADIIAKVRAALAPEFAAKDAQIHGLQSRLGSVTKAQGWDKDTVEAIVSAVTDRDTVAEEAKALGVPDTLLKYAKTAAEVREIAATYQPRIASPAAAAPEDAISAAVAKALQGMGVTPTAPAAKPSTTTMTMTQGAGLPGAGGETFATLTNKNINKMTPNELRSFARIHEEQTLEAIKRFGVPAPGA